jgi:hypothetical protein
VTSALIGAGLALLLDSEDDRDILLVAAQLLDRQSEREPGASSPLGTMTTPPR